MPQCSWKKSHNGIDNHRRPQLSSRKDIVPNRDLAIAQKLIDTFVDALIPSADHHDPLDAATSSWAIA